MSELYLYQFTHIFVSMKLKDGSESVIADSVRSLIINFLEDGTPKRFKEITRTLDKHDYVIKRELDFLIDRGWVIRTGSGHTTRYTLNMTKESLKEYISKLALTHHENWNIQEVLFDPLYYQKNIPRIKDIYESLGKGETEADKFLNEMKKIEKTTKKQLSEQQLKIKEHLKTYIVSEPLDEFLPRSRLPLLATVNRAEMDSY